MLALLPLALVGLGACGCHALRGRLRVSTRLLHRTERHAPLFFYVRAANLKLT